MLDLILLLFKSLMGPGEEETNVLDVLKSICVVAVMSQVLPDPGRLFQMLVRVFSRKLLLVPVS